MLRLLAPRAGSGSAGSPAALLLLAASCSSVAFRPDVAAALERVDRERLVRDVQLLTDIGPRPVSDEEATRVALDVLSDALEGLGFEVHEERFPVFLPRRMVARVRPLGEPDAEPTELEVPPDLALTGGEAMRATAARLAEEGWDVESYVLQTGEPVQLEAFNLLAFRAGTSEPASVVEVSAHYDSVSSSPGAADNASGVAVLLELAHVLAAVPTRLSVRLCFFGAEELGLVGSRRHVAGLPEEERLVALVNLDSVALTAAGPGSQRRPEGIPWFLPTPDEADFVAVVGHGDSAWLGNLFEDALETYVPELPYYSLNRLGHRFADSHRSDHAPYWAAGLPALFLTDTAEFRAATYHTPGDTFDTLDLDFLEAVTRATAATVLHLAEPVAPASPFL